MIFIDHSGGNCHGNSVHDNSVRPEKPRRFQLIPVIVNQFKSSVTREIYKKYLDCPFAWQKSFHDRIIRDESELNRIREYIQNNPQNWDLDEGNIKN